MIIKISKPDIPFVMVPNCTAADNRLRPEDLGVLTYLLSKPADWHVKSSELQTRFAMGRNRVYTILRRLQSAGYASFVREVTGKTTWTISAEPASDNLMPELVMSPHAQKPDEEKPHEDFQHVYKERNRKKKDNEKKIISEQLRKIRDAFPDRPGQSWADAEKALAARLREGVAFEDILAGVKKYAEYCEANKTEPRFIKHAKTFLGPGEHWLADWGVDEHARVRQMTDQEFQRHAQGQGLSPARPGETFSEWRTRVGGEAPC
jgi:hypothetical protein